jgi:hypothetical protein
MAINETIPNTLPVPLDTTISDLARRSGLSRTTVRRRLREGWTPADLITVDAEEIPQRVQALSSPVQAERPGAGRHWIPGLACVAIGVGFAGIGLAMNAYSYGSLGRTPTEVFLSSAGGIAIDAVAIAGLSIGVALWWSRHRLASLAAFAAWLGFTPLSMIPTASFNSRLLDDATAGRAQIIGQATDARTQRADAIEIAQANVAAAEQQAKAECNPTRGPKCREREADERKARSELAAANAVPIPSSASLAAADPGAKMLADILGFLGANERSIRRIQVAGLTVAPATAGLFLAFATMLLGGRRD